MIALPLTRGEMEERWAQKRPARPVKREPAPRPLNLRHVLDLGSTVYFTFRGRPYGIPPLAWREGEVILDARMEAMECAERAAKGGRVQRDLLPAYFAALRRLQAVLWRSTRPVGPVRRTLHLLHLHRNPFRRATEREVVELADFMLGRRMTSAGLTIPGAPGPAT